MKGQIARRAIELGGFPVRSLADPGVPLGDRVHPCREGGEKPRSFSAPPALWLSKPRLIQAMRKIDPDLAHMIESLAPVYLVKE